MENSNQGNAPHASPWRRLGCIALAIGVLLMFAFASVVVPNILAILEDNRASHARADIAAMEVAFVKLLADSGQTSLGALLDQNAIRTALHLPETGPPNNEQFLRLSETYSNAYIALLIKGRDVLEQTDTEPTTGLPFRQLFNEPVVKRLGLAYCNISLDPWQIRYNIFPGPWPKDYGPIVFRLYRQAPREVNPNWTAPDSLTITKAPDGKEFVDPESKETYVIGVPAKGDKVAYVWSRGHNLTSDQALLVAASGDNDPLKHYDMANKDVLEAGGGDDINNWDNGAIRRSFYPRHRR